MRKNPSSSNNVVGELLFGQDLAFTAKSVQKRSEQ